MMFQYPTPGLIRYILCDDAVSVPDPGFNKVQSV